MKKLFFVLILLASSANAQDSIVVIGQSNAVGIANYGGLEAKTGMSVINCAMGGVEIRKLMPSYDIATLYGKCMEKINRNVRLGNKVVGIVFAQGESDAQRILEDDKKTPVLYQWLPRVTRLLRTLRDDIGNGNIPIALYVMNSINDGEVFPYWWAIRKYQLRLTLPNVVKFDSDNYPFAMDEKNPQYLIHLSIDGYDKIGTDIACMFKK